MDGLNWFYYCENNPVSHTDSTGNSIEPETAQFLVASILFFVGYVILLNGVVPDIAWKLHKLEYQLSKLKNFDPRLNSQFMNARDVYSKRIALKGQIRSARAQGATLAVLGYVMVCSALIMDIDLGVSMFGQDMLTWWMMD